MGAANVWVPIEDTGRGLLRERFGPPGGPEDTIEDLEGKGVELPAQISEHDWSRVVAFRDPGDNDLQLYEPPIG